MVRKTRQGGRLVRIETQIAHGSSKWVARELSRLGFSKANTSTIERRMALPGVWMRRVYVSSESVLDQAGPGSVGSTGLQLGPGV